jgi:hypothetical protein
MTYRIHAWRALPDGSSECSGCQMRYEPGIALPPQHAPARVQLEKSGHIHRWRVIPGGLERCDDCRELRQAAFENLPTKSSGERWANRVANGVIDD